MDKDKQIKKILRYSIDDLKGSSLLKRGLLDLESIEDDNSKNRILFRHIAVEAIEEGKTAKLKLARLILESAFECFAMVKDVEGVKDDRAKQIIVFSEFLYFFLHYSARMVDSVDRNLRSDLLDELGLWTMYASVETLWEEAPEQQKDSILEQEYKDLNDREQTYSKCKELFSKYDDSKSLKENLIKSNGTVNQLIVQLGYVVLGRLVDNTEEDSLFMRKIGNAVMEALTKNKSEIEALIPDALKETDKSSHQ